MSSENTIHNLCEQYREKDRIEALRFIAELGKSNPDLAAAVLELVAENNKKRGQQ